jgi:hypothetical protein
MYVLFFTRRANGMFVLWQLFLSLSLSLSYSFLIENTEQNTACSSIGCFWKPKSPALVLCTTHRAPVARIISKIAGGLRLYSARFVCAGVVRREHDLLQRSSAEWIIYIYFYSAVNVLYIMLVAHATICLIR